MKAILFLLIASVALIGASMQAGAPPNYAGDYADQNYLKGTAVFQLNVEQNGQSVSLYFSASKKDGKGEAPNGQGWGKIDQAGDVEFQWTDSSNNGGAGRLRKSGNDIIMALQAAHVGDARCLIFYSNGIHLKPTGKK